MEEKKYDALSEAAKAWGFAPFSYAALCAGQLCAGAGLDGPTGFMLCVLGLFSLLLIFAHKGVSFDEARSRSRGGLIRFPWSQKTTHVIVCAATMLVCSQLIEQERLMASIAGSAGTVFAALAGWFATLVPGPTKP